MATQLREAIEEFIKGRLETKLETIDKEIKKAKKKERDTSELEEKHGRTIEGHVRETWLAEHARRAASANIATHVIKYMHPGAKGSSVYFDDSAQELAARRDNWVGTHDIDKADRTDDMLATASALALPKLFGVKCGAKTFLDSASHDSQELAHAMSDDTQLGLQWAKAFANVCSTSGDTGGPVTDRRAKQIYFPVGDSYHLLAPLFPTSMVHTVGELVNDARWSEEAQEAFKARKDNKPSDHGYKVHAGMAIQKFGGANPQNIGQLNVVRGGKVKLLSAIPPTWQGTMRPRYGMDTVFNYLFGGRRPVIGITRGLTNFLCRVRAYNNWDIRKARAIIVDKLVDQLVQFMAEHHAELQPGWSADPKCGLNRYEMLWLDPKRAQDDHNFKHDWHNSDWQHEVADMFAVWFNAQLRYYSTDEGELNVTKVEQREWRKLAEQALIDYMGGEPYDNE